MRTRAYAFLLLACIFGSPLPSLGADTAVPPGPLWPTAGEERGTKALRMVAPPPDAQAVLAAVRGHQRWPHFQENVQPRKSLAPSAPPS